MLICVLAVVMKEFDMQVIDIAIEELRSSIIEEQSKLTTNQVVMKITKYLAEKYDAKVALDVLQTFMIKI